MIKEISISNFQSHKKTNIELSPGVNVFIGPSDSGKTTVVRAIKWVRANRPLGESFRSKWGGNTEVEIKVTDQECIVRREKTGKDNKYRLIYPEETLEFKALGKDVPDEINKALNISDVNVMSQLDPLFLLSMSSGEVAQTLNRYVNLEQIDTTQTNIESQLRKIKEDKERQNLLINTLEKELTDFEFLDKAEIDLKIIMTLDKDFEKLKSLSNSLSSLIETINTIKKQIDITNLIIKDSVIIKELENKQSEISQKLNRVQKLSSNIASIQECENRLKALSNILDAEKALKQITGRSGKLVETLSSIQTLENALFDINSLKSNIERIKRSLVADEKEWERIAPETCPLCDGTGKLK